MLSFSNQYQFPSLYSIFIGYLASESYTRTLTHVVHFSCFLLILRELGLAKPQNAGLQQKNKQKKKNNKLFEITFQHFKQHCSADVQREMLHTGPLYELICINSDCNSAGY